jgi:hypothetical protein
MFCGTGILDNRSSTFMISLGSNPTETAAYKLCGVKAYS